MLHTSLLRAMTRAEPQTPAQLAAIAHAWLDLELVRAPLLPDSAGQLDYLSHAFFRGTDCVVWAGRGGGKTMLAAAACLLEMIFKPGIQIRVLAGSLEQASKLHEHLCALLDRPLMQHIVGDPPTQRRVHLANGSTLSLLAGSQRSVRGVRVQRLRCDEIDELEPELWSAAQLVTRSTVVQGRPIRAGIEALSTMHRSAGLMSRLTADTQDESPSNPSVARPPAARFRWTTLDVAARCPPQYPCHGCPLEADCRGRAKHATGFVPIDDLIQQRLRTSDHTWAAEIMCRRPSVDDLVYAQFSRERHVTAEPPFDPATPKQVVAGLDFGIRNYAVLLWAEVEQPADRRTQPHLHVIDELAMKDRTLSQLLEQAAMRRPEAPDWIAVDPAGNARSSQTALTDIDVVKAAGHTVRFNRTRIHPGIDRVRQRLDHDKLTVHPRCLGLISAMTTYHFPAGRPEAGDPVKDGPDHWTDALRYLITNLDAATSTSSLGHYL